MDNVEPTDYILWDGYDFEDQVEMEDVLTRLEAAAKAAGIGFRFSRESGALEFELPKNDMVATYRPYCPGDPGEEAWSKETDRGIEWW